jgi:hypothetical protein
MSNKPNFKAIKGGKKENPPVTKGKMGIRPTAGGTVQLILGDFIYEFPPDAALAMAQTLANAAQQARALASANALLVSPSGAPVSSEDAE